MNGTIAIVEDEQNIRDNVAFALKREGYQVSAYADGQAAWDAFQQQLPDLVVLDIIMPRMDGLELCRRIERRSIRDNPRSAAVENERGTLRWLSRVEAG